MATFDFVELIEHNPLTRLSATCNSSLSQKLKSKFSGYEQQMFLTSFYGLLNYNQFTDFVVDFDTIWEWLGYFNKGTAKRALIKGFKLGEHYIIVPLDNSDVSSDANRGSPQHGGQNKEKLLLNIRTFKLFCMSAGTVKANQIHKYYIELEELLMEVIQENNDEVTQLLTLKNNEIEQMKEEKVSDEIKVNIEKERLKELTQINSFNLKPVIYIGYVEDNIIKFGKTGALRDRIACHKNKIGPQFLLLNVIETVFKSRVENMIKQRLKPHIISNVYKGKTQVELIRLSDDFTLDMFYQNIHDYVKECHANITVATQEKEIEDKDEIISDCKITQQTLEAQIQTHKKQMDKLTKTLADANRCIEGRNGYIDSLALEIHTLTKKIQTSGDDGSVCDNAIIAGAVALSTLNDEKAAQEQANSKKILSEKQIAVFASRSQRMQEYNANKRTTRLQNQETPPTNANSLKENNSCDVIEANPVNSSANTTEVVENSDEPVNTTDDEAPQAPVVVSDKKVKIVKANKRNQQSGPFIAESLLTGERTEFSTFRAASVMCQITEHALQDNYLNKPHQHRGYVFYHVSGGVRWIPPANYKYDIEQKPSLRMKQCRSIDLVTREIIYYNSATEAATYLRNTYQTDPKLNLNICFDTFRRSVSDATLGINSSHYPIYLYQWNQCTAHVGTMVKT